MGDSVIDKSGVEKDVNSCQHEGVSHDLFARLLIQRIVGFLEQRPSDFAITILPPMPPVLEKQNKGEVAGGKVNASTRNSDQSCSLSLESLSTEQRSLLESCVVLMHEPGSSGKLVGHLGLEAQHLPQIARTLRKTYRQVKKKYQTTSDPSQTETEELFHVTSCLLLIQPDHATAWADRRRCLLLLQNCETEIAKSLGSSFPGESMDEDAHFEDEDGSLVLWSGELDYLDILFTQHSKAPSSWAHRKYSLRQILHQVEEGYQRTGNMERVDRIRDIIFAREVKTCIEVAEKYPKNYYAWTHRRYLWDLFSFQSSGTETKDQLKRQDRREGFIQLLETELMIGMWQEWLQIHPADHSAVHYSCQVLDLLLKEMTSLQLEGGEQASIGEKIRSLSVSALDQVQILLRKFSHENESLWILRRITYKVLWKHLHYPSIAEKFPKKKCMFDTMASSVRLLLRNDLKSILLSTLKSDYQLPCDDSDIANTSNIYVWTFLAWCMVNLHGLDSHQDDTINSDVATSGVGVLFTAEIREKAFEYLTSNMEPVRHNHLVYTSSRSPFAKSISTAP